MIIKVVKVFLYWHVLSWVLCGQLFHNRGITEHCSTGIPIWDFTKIMDLIGGMAGY
jgi:hypothetical protein